MEKKKEKKKSSEKICETFEIEKESKEKIIKTCGNETEKHSSKNDAKKENKILAMVLLFLGIALISFIIVFFIIDSSKKFTYNNIKFDIIKEKEVKFYHTVVPLSNGNIIGNYNVFLRKDPRVIGKNVPLKGKVFLSDMLVLNSTDNFNCDGDGVIAIANFQQIISGFGTKIINDKNATCDEQGRYMFVNLLKGNETKIERFGPVCYNFYINNCEILEVTERFLLNLLERENQKNDAPSY